MKTTLPRLGVSSWSADTDLWPGRVGINTELATLNANAAKWAQGATAARPVAGTAGFYFWDTNTNRLYYDNGTAWTEASPIGGGGVPTSNDIGDTGIEGASRIGARADHQHAMPVPATDPAASTYGGVMTRGVSTTGARADHKHALVDLPRAAAVPPAISSFNVAAALGVSTDLARADHSHQLPVVVLPSAGTFIGATGALPTNYGLVRVVPIHTAMTADVNGALSLPLPFTNGLLGLSLMNGDSAAANVGLSFAVYPPNTNPGSAHVIVTNSTGARPGAVRMIGFAIGW